MSFWLGCENASRQLIDDIGRFSLPESVTKIADMDSVKVKNTVTVS
jgi:hypothetical protein